MDTTTLEHEMLNCPDCQLQTLQQQQAQQQHNSQLNQKHQHVSSSEDTKDLGPTSQSTRNSGSSSYNSSHHNVPPDPRLHPTSPSSSDSTQLHHHQNLQYRNPPMPSHYNAGSSACTAGQSLQLSSSSSLSSQLATNPSTVTGPSAAEMYPTGNLTPLPMEGCDISGYCATCAVLDLPANDKYYRPPPLSRHSVFPSMFYSQPPPIPGFSPVPDCNLWSNSNDYGPYSYTSAYQQPQQSTPSDYYSNCNVLPSTQAHTEASSQIQQSTSCSFFQSSLPTSTSSEEKKVSVNAVIKEPSKTQFTKTVSSTRTRAQENNAICISSSSDETSDSESYISQREVIVEDDDDNDDASVSMSICDMDQNQRCVVCQISIMTDCSSPQLQLVNILENIHEDITAEDLDITVSSGDIEIGGIEDEVRDFQQPKKSAACHVTFTRLAYLLNIPSSVLLSVNEGSENSTDVPEDQDMAPLCNKCGRLAGTIDALEKQLTSNCLVLKQLLQAQMGTDFEKTVVNDVKVQIEKTDSTSEINSQKKCSDVVAVKFASVQTQTEGTCADYPVPRNPASCIRQRDLPSPKNLINFRDIRLEYATDSVRIGEDTTEKCYQSAEASMGSLNISGSSARFPCSLMTSTNPELEIIFPDVNNTTESSDCSVWLPSSADATEKHADHLCEECGQILACRRTFEVHMKRHHNELRFQCTDCLKSFVTIAALKVHLRCHSGERPFVCIKCNKGFSTKSNLNAHSETCKKTEECSHVKSRTLMADFQYNKLQNSEKFKCNDCGISFRLKYRFDVHVQKGCGSKSLECSHCQKKFTKQSELKVHMLTHDSKKPFACDTCGLSFATKGNLSAHMRIHSEEKRFKCQICDKGFNRKQALQLHVNRHNGLKPFSCEVCNRKFSDPSNLQSHKKTHEKKQ